MTKTLTNVDSPATTVESLFVPMTEDQMAAAKGGTDWPDWLDDLIDQFEDLLEYLDGILNEDPDDFDEAEWIDLEENLAEDGYVPYTEEEIAQDW